MLIVSYAHHDYAAEQNLQMLDMMGDLDATSMRSYDLLL